MLSEVFRERGSIALTLVVAILLSISLVILRVGVESAASSKSQSSWQNIAGRTLTETEMSTAIGRGPISLWGGIAAVAVGVTLVAVAVACVAAPPVGAIVIASLLGSGINLGVGAAIVGGGGLAMAAGGAASLTYQEYLP